MSVLTSYDTEREEGAGTITGVFVGPSDLSLRDQLPPVKARDDLAGHDGVAVRRVMAVVVKELRARRRRHQPRSRVVGLPVLLCLPVRAQRRQRIQVRDASPGAELAAPILRPVVLLTAQQ